MSSVNDRTTRDLEDLGLLFEIARNLDRHVDLRQALGPLLDLLENHAGLCRGMVTLLDRNEGLLKIEEAWGLDSEEKKRGRYRLGEGLVGRVFESGTSLVVPDLSKETRFLNRAGGRSPEDLVAVSWYCVPIRSGSTVRGTLSAERRFPVDMAREDPQGFEDKLASDRRILERTAELVADSAKLRERILEEQFSARPDEAGDISREFLAQSGQPTSTSRFPGIIGTSAAMNGLFDLLEQVAPSDATVLVTGESGTGKELVATELHRLSRRSKGPLVKVNCAALPESVIESELFGHEKGAFTGAVSQRKGRFELASGGSIFLDEIGELSLQVQVKLLRVLQEREIERIGGAATIPVDVRVIAATNRDLEREIAEGRFREDLFYRLNVFPLRMPPLRERKSDIVLLADFFAARYGERNAKLIKRISSPAIDLLTSYHWPGNVRELENCIERAVILSQDSVIHSWHLPPSLQSAESTNTAPASTLEAALSRLEKELIVEALKMSAGNMAAASRQLGITERQIGLRVHHYGINWKLYRRQTAD